MLAKHTLRGLCTLAIAAPLLLASGISYAEDQKAASPSAPDPEQTAVVVNGTKLTNRDLVAYARSFASRGQQIQKDAALNGLIDRELLYQEALAKGMDKNPDAIAEMKSSQRALLANVLISEMLRAQPVKDEEMRKFYQEKVVTLKAKEYKARHILVPTEAEAKDVISQLDAGADFAELAKKKSKDTSSGVQGGELGWFNPSDMVPEFSQAAATLAKGKYTKKPVQSQFGWHVILLEDSRDVPPPKFDDVKAQLENAVRTQRIGDYLATLRKKAKIENK